MQAVAEKTRKKKRRLLPVLLIYALVLAAGAYYWFYIRGMANQNANAPEFTPVATDQTGNNLEGNVPENLAAGGFVAGQDGWVYFSNFADGASLYMSRQDGTKMTKVTDFPVANINVMADTLVFTSLEKCRMARIDGVFEITFETPRELPGMAQYSQTLQYGGRLYAANGIRSGKGIDFYCIDPENTYYMPCLTKSGLFAISQRTMDESVGAKAMSTVNQDHVLSLAGLGQDFESDEYTYSPATPVDGETCVLTEKTTGRISAVAKEGELLVKYFVKGSVMYAEMRAVSGRTSGRIVRIDLETMQPIDSIRGYDLYKSGANFVFINSDDGFIYELDAVANSILPISTQAYSSIAMSQNQQIIADGGATLLSRTRKTNFIETIYEKIYPQKVEITRQNGWFNIMNPKQDDMAEYPGPGFFAAGDKYYRLHKTGVWFENGKPSLWLNSVREDALAKQADFTPVQKLTSSGINPIPQQDIDEPDIPKLEPEDKLDQPDQPGQNGKRDATATPEDSITATYMLMVGDEAVAEKFTGESIDKLKSHYGGSLDETINAGAQRFSEMFMEKLGASPKVPDLAALLKKWFKEASFEAGQGILQGNNADVPVKITNVIDINTLSSALETEIPSRAAKNPAIILSSREKQAEWAVGIFMEIASNPEQYGAKNTGEVDVTVKMINMPSIGWVANNPKELAGHFEKAMG